MSKHSDLFIPERAALTRSLKVIKHHGLANEGKHRGAESSERILAYSDIWVLKGLGTNNAHNC